MAHAVELYRDDLAQGLYDEWLAPLRDEYRRRLLDALARLASFQQKDGDIAAALVHAERLVSIDPLREESHRLLIRLHLATGDRPSALRAYHRCLRLLRRELGVDPDAATRELHRAALQADSGPSEGEPVSAPADPAAGTAAALLSAPLVGRDREWNLLLDSWRATVAGQARLAAIMGEPGIGKSRLAEELFDRCARGPGSAARARCYAAQGQLAFAPIAEWLRSPSLRAACSKLPAAQFDELVRVLPELADPTPRDAAPLDRPGGQGRAWERRHFFEALHAAFRSAPGPRLLLLDDLQWCDPDTLDYLQALLRCGISGLLILATLRPEETGRDHPASKLRVELTRTDQVTEIPLGALSAQETASLAARLGSSTLDQADLDELYRTTQGNPLFVVECMRAGLRHPDATRRIHAVIEARLAQLTPAAFELAGLAAAAGRAFLFELIAKASDWDEASLTEALDELWQRRLIESREGALYDFTHDRIREVAGLATGPIRWRSFHRKLARALEDLHADDRDGVSLLLASHYSEAGMAREAIERYREAASVARKRFADKDAAASLRQALELCAQLAPSARRDALELELRVLHGAAQVSTIGYAMPEVGETYTRALALSSSLKEETQLPFVLAGSWVYRVVRCELGAARGHASRLLDLGKSVGDVGLEAAGDFTLGSSLFHLGKLTESRDHVARTIARYGNVSHAALTLFAGPDIGLFAQSYLSHLLWHLGQADAADEASCVALDSAARVGHPFSGAIALGYAAVLSSFRGDRAQASKHSQAAVTLCGRHEFAYYLAMAEIVAGWAERDGGLLRAGMERMRRTGAEIRMPYYYGLLAELCAERGDMGEALASLSNGFAYMGKNSELWTAPHLYRVQGDLFRASGDAARAASSYEKSLEAAREIGAVAFERIIVPNGSIPETGV